MAASEDAFTILALAPLIGEDMASSEPRITRVDPEEPDRAVEHLAPSLLITVSKTLCPEGDLTFRPARMRSFSPGGAIDACPFLGHGSPRPPGSWPKRPAARLDVIETIPAAGRQYERVGFVPVRNQHFKYLRLLSGFQGRDTNGV
jgi:hypothetical protein